MHMKLDFSIPWRCFARPLRPLWPYPEQLPPETRPWSAPQACCRQDLALPHLHPRKQPSEWDRASRTWGARSLALPQHLLCPRQLSAASLQRGRNPVGDGKIDTMSDCHLVNTVQWPEDVAPRAYIRPGNGVKAARFDAGGSRPNPGPSGPVS